MKRKRLRDELGAILGIALFYFLLESVGITCPILYLTGVSCAGCGMSRAWLAVLHGNLQEAFAFHPLFWMVVPMGILFLFWEKLPARVRKWTVGGIAALFIGVYLLRMADQTDRIVYFDPAGGLIARGFTYILHIIS